MHSSYIYLTSIVQSIDIKNSQSSLSIKRMVKSVNDLDVSIPTAIPSTPQIISQIHDLIAKQHLKFAQL